MCNSQQKLTTLYFQGNLFICISTNVQEIENIPMLFITSVKFDCQGAAVCCYEARILQEKTKQYKFTKVLKELSTLQVINTVFPSFQPTLKTIAIQLLKIL